MKFANYTIIASAPSDDDFESEVIALDQIIKASFQIAVSAGTVTGEIQVQVSNDPPLKGDSFGVPNADPQAWSNLGSAVSLTSDAVFLIAQQDLCYRWMRVLYTNSDPGNDSTISINVMSLSI